VTFIFNHEIGLKGSIKSMEFPLPPQKATKLSREIHERQKKRTGGGEFEKHGTALWGPSCALQLNSQLPAAIHTEEAGRGAWSKSNVWSDQKENTLRVLLKGRILEIRDCIPLCSQFDVMCCLCKLLHYHRTMLSDAPKPANAHKRNRDSVHFI
jgi:hypothetical protein